jgi:pimeloyl-ACP methyl ester carboxylesterase
MHSRCSDSAAGSGAQRDTAAPAALINGQDLSWRAAGKAGEPLILVHGSWEDHHSWDPVVNRLARTFRVVTYDRRGHGGSSGTGTIHDDVADLAALVEHLGLAPAHIAGSSSGASIVLRLASIRPDLFRTLIAHEPPLLALLDDVPDAQQTLAGIRAELAQVGALLQLGQFEPAARHFMERIALGPGAWLQLPAAVRARFIANAPTFLEELADPDFDAMDLDALRRFTAPLVLTQGQASPRFFHMVVERLSRSLPSAVVRVLPRAGHVPHATTPGQFIQLLADCTQRGPG